MSKNYPTESLQFYKPMNFFGKKEYDFHCIFVPNCFDHILPSSKYDLDIIPTKDIYAELAYKHNNRFENLYLLSYCEDLIEFLPPCKTVAQLQQLLETTDFNYSVNEVILQETLKHLSFSQSKQSFLLRIHTPPEKCEKVWDYNCTDKYRHWVYSFSELSSSSAPIYFYTSTLNAANKAAFLQSCFTALFKTLSKKSQTRIQLGLYRLRRKLILKKLRQLISILRSFSKRVIRRHKRDLRKLYTTLLRVHFKSLNDPTDDIAIEIYNRKNSIAFITHSIYINEYSGNHSLFEKFQGT